jgi:NADH-quinone oxidoreductase subunit C
MLSNEAMLARVHERLADAVLEFVEDRGELTLEIERDRIVEVCGTLCRDSAFCFEQLIDLSGVDYMNYAKEHIRGRQWHKTRFAVVYHLLSITNNIRLRLRVWLDDDAPVIASVVDVWSVANWFEREAFDLFGIVFEGHPDLRRILTDYGFIGHPFRKDFPLSGHIEMRYDPDKQRVVYQPVTIEPRTLVPRVIREEGFGDRDP